MIFIPTAAPNCYLWLSILVWVKVSFSLSASTRSRIPVAATELDSMFRLFRVLLTFSICAEAIATGSSLGVAAGLSFLSRVLVSKVLEISSGLALDCS